MLHGLEVLKVVIAKNDPFYTWASKNLPFCCTVKSKYFWLADWI